MAAEEGEVETSKMKCSICGHVGLADGYDGFFYCNQCGSRADDIMDTGVADEDFVPKGGGDQRGALYQAIHTRHRSQPLLTPSQPLQSQIHSKFWSQLTENAMEKEKRGKDVKSEFGEVKRELEGDFMGPIGPEDFGSGGGEGDGGGLAYEDYYNEVRKRYVMGLQMMVMWQCECLVDKFKVTPLIVGVVGTIWMRFVAVSKVFEEAWADDVVQDSELQTEGEAGDIKRPIRHKAEPHNLYGRRAVTIWLKSLRKSIPLSCSLAVSFLACHVCREPVLTTDIVKWCLEGKLPYFSSFVNIGKQMGERSRACPISASVMFKPSHMISSQRLESLAASIAQGISLSLPPVNFHKIALRYLKQLSLPVDKILTHACRIQNWSMPPELYLSTNELRLPTRVCVMSILILTIRILYNINGFGVWERSLSSDSDHERSLGAVSSSEIKDDAYEEPGSPSCDVDGPDAKSVGNSSDTMKPEFDAEELLKHLEAKYCYLAPSFEYSKDLETYLRFCKDIVFAGAEASSIDNEYKTTGGLWNIYKDERDLKPSEDLQSQYGTPSHGTPSHGTPSKRKRFLDDSISLARLSLEDETVKDKGYHSSPSTSIKDCSLSNSSVSSLRNQTSIPKNQTPSETLKDRAIRRMKTNMEENRFCYIPPRVKLKRLDYLHYVRKRDEGALTYVAHADYYILLRACARVAEIEIRIMHMGVLSFERRMAWLENRIEQCLHLRPPTMTCEFCSDVPEVSVDLEDDTLGLESLNI